MQEETSIAKWSPVPPKKDTMNHTCRATRDLTVFPRPNRIFIHRFIRVCAFMCMQAALTCMCVRAQGKSVAIFVRTMTGDDDFNDDDDAT